MKKRAISIFVMMVLFVSVIGIQTASAASISISGKDQVYAGEQYTYNISVSDNAWIILARISWSGVASGNSGINKEAAGNSNESITASGSITIDIPADAQVGSTCTINVEGEVSYFNGGDPTYDYPKQSKTITVAAKPTSTPKPDSTPKPTKKPTSNKTESKPTATPEPSAWQLASDEVDGMEKGGTLTVDLTDEDDDHEIPVEVYNVLREKKGKLTLNFGTYSCTLDGAALGELDEDEDELDLGLTFEKDEEYSASVDGNDVYQLHFDHKGEFPGKISFTFKADKNSPGDTVYLYYYYGTSKVIQGIQSAVVDENGYVTFDIYHCSSYFVSSSLIEGAAGIVAQPEPEPTPTPTVEPTPEPTEMPTPTPAPEPNPETSEPVQTNGFPLVVLVAVGLGTALIGVLITMIVFRVGPFTKKRKRNSEY